MNLNKDPERWALVKPDAFLTGSIVQARNVIEMALHDIAVLHAEVLRLQIEAEIQRVELAEAMWGKR